MYNPSTDPYQTCIEDLCSRILTIPLLPNRLPLNSLAFLAPRLPLPYLRAVSVPHIQSSITSDDARVHLISNLAALAPVRYTSLPPEALIAYLHLIAETMKNLPVHALEPPERNARLRLAWADDDDLDAAENVPQIEVVTSFTHRRDLPQLDSKTRTRLQTLPSQSHLNSLLSATHKHTNTAMRAALFSWLHALSTVWPSRRDKITANVVAWSGGGLVRELYRAYVRSSPLGQGGLAATLTGAFPLRYSVASSDRLGRSGECTTLAAPTLPRRPVQPSIAYYG